MLPSETVLYFAGRSKKNFKIKQGDMINRTGSPLTNGLLSLSSVLNITDSPRSISNQEANTFSVSLTLSFITRGRSSAKGKTNKQKDTKKWLKEMCTYLDTQIVIISQETHRPKKEEVDLFCATICCLVAIFSPLQK